VPCSFLPSVAQVMITMPPGLQSRTMLRIVFLD